MSRSLSEILDKLKEDELVVLDTLARNEYQDISHEAVTIFPYCIPWLREDIPKESKLNGKSIRRILDRLQKERLVIGTKGTEFEMFRYDKWAQRLYWWEFASEVILREYVSLRRLAGSEKEKRGWKREKRFKRFKELYDTFRQDALKRKTD